MNDTVVVAAIMAVPPTLVAFAALLQSRHTESATQRVDKKTDELKTQTDEIHILVNSNLSRVTTELAEANQHIVELHELVANMMKTDAKSKLAEHPEGPPIEPLLAASKTVDAALKTVEVVSDSTLRK